MGSPGLHWLPLVSCSHAWVARETGSVRGGWAQQRAGIGPSTCHGSRVQQEASVKGTQAAARTGRHCQCSWCTAYRLALRGPGQQLQAGRKPQIIEGQCMPAGVVHHVCWHRAKHARYMPMLDAAAHHTCGHGPRLPDHALASVECSWRCKHSHTQALPQYDLIAPCRPPFASHKGRGR